jgi:hypothetical protein
MPGRFEIMTLMLTSEHAGSWHGTNGFRLMPGDPQQHSPATATVFRAAGGQLTSIAYTWSHPEDGNQDGLLVLGPGDSGPGEQRGVIWFWGDSWHQKPEPKLLAGSIGRGGITVSYAYEDEWRWQITLDTSVPGELNLLMENVVPASAGTGDLVAGPYAVMLAELRKA